MGSLLGSRGTKGNNWQESSSSSTPGFAGQLESVLNTVMTGWSPYNKGAAQADMTGALRTQASDALQSVMPSIAKSQIASGAYNSTTKNLLQNDAEARIQAQLANSVADNIARYAGIEANLINSFANASQAGRVTTQQSQGSGSTRGGGSGILGLFADGGQVPDPGVMDQLMAMVGAMIKKDAQPTLDAFQAVQSGDSANILKQLFPDNIWDTTAKKREKDAGITINVGNGG